MRNLPPVETRVGALIVGYIESVVTYADYTAQATSEALSLPALPAGSFPLRAKVLPLAYFTGNSNASAALDIGDTGDPDGLLDNLDVFTGGATIGTWAGTPGVEAFGGTKPAATVGTDIAAFTDPPSAAEMALLRTFVNALKADVAALRGVRGPVEEASYTAKALLTCSVNVDTLTAGSFKVRQYYQRWDDE